MFDSQIQPTLTYGSEIWGLSDNQECTERVHLSALKTMTDNFCMVDSLMQANNKKNLNIDGCL